jgi:hypothetical protein
MTVAEGVAGPVASLPSHPQHQTLELVPASSTGAVMAHAWKEPRAISSVSLVKKAMGVMCGPGWCWPSPR